MPLYQMKPRVGPHRMRDDRVLRPGDRIRCTEEELGAGLDKFIVVEEDPTPEKAPGTIPFVISHRKGGWYDVRNAISGVALNDNAMRLTEVAEMLGMPEDEIARLAEAALDDEPSEDANENDENTGEGGEPEGADAVTDDGEADEKPETDFR